MTEDELQAVEARAELLGGMPRAQGDLRALCAEVRRLRAALAEIARVGEDYEEGREAMLARHALEDS